MTSPKDILLLLDRPEEPIFMPKGEEQVQFSVPREYFREEYQPLGQQISTRFGEESTKIIHVPKISMPYLGEILAVKRDENYSIFIDEHKKASEKLINIFLGMENLDHLLAVACYCRERVNTQLFNYCLSVALLHRPDTKGVDIPSLIRTFPDKYVHSSVFKKAREEANIVPQGSRTPIEIGFDRTANNLDEENRVSYFREDLGINLHHWHWHLVYPTCGPLEVINKDRRGELFYYMHQQILARYNFERFCNHLKRVERLIDYRAPIKEAYFPKLDSHVAGRSWPPRGENQVMKTLRRDDNHIFFDIKDLDLWRDNIVNAIRDRKVKTSKGEYIELDEERGIDILGNIIESSCLSVNPDFYGNLHGMGHVAIAFIHDPDRRYKEPAAVMGDTATAMRDPVFYRWHSFVDDLFVKHKLTLPRYSEEVLDFPGISVTGIQIQTEHSKKPNVFETFWQQSDVDLSKGMDYQPRGSIYVRFTHLNHKPFNYTINVVNHSTTKQGTCRIFLAPKFDEKGSPWTFTQQRMMFIELDKFKVILKHGRNTITRRSDQSSVTIPFERTFRDLNTRETSDDKALFNFCGCGWPHHMLIPKGTVGGMDCQLFVMISDHELDKVEQDVEGVCNDSESYCGIKDKRYPDKRSMGFPFDRAPRDGVQNLQQFLTSNMRVQDCTIKFLDQTFRPKSYPQ